MNFSFLYFLPRSGVSLRYNAIGNLIKPCVISRANCDHDLNKHVIIEVCSQCRRFTFSRIDISHASVYFYESAEKVLSYARLNCAVFNYFYMSLGQVRHTIVVSRYQNHRKDNEIQL